MSFSIKVAMTYSPTNLCSTIGAVGLNFSVRDGKRWIPNAINRLNKGLMPCISYKVKVYYLRFRYGNFSCLLRSFLFAVSQILKVWPKALTRFTSLLEVRS